PHKENSSATHPITPEAAQVFYRAARRISAPKSYIHMTVIINESHCGQTGFSMGPCHKALSYMQKQGKAGC
ncbi:hypothetical protein LI129_24145, partial [Erysipelatoclostridium ramosum]|uniref:hypothetical protein n=1 Tax=Thomasclavelia ramosa TaxID=1547 RepID=UPI001D084E59